MPHNAAKPDNTMDGNAILKELRDIHTPDGVALWPLAPSWWLLLVGMVIVLFVWIWWRWLNVRKRSLKAFLSKLMLLQLQYQKTNDMTHFISALSILMRRYVLSLYPRRQVAALTGDEWLAFLDRTGGNGEFSRGIGRILKTGPYTLHAYCDVAQLLDCVKKWAIKAYKTGAREKA